MKCMVTNIGCDKKYGERQVVVEDDQIGAVAIREMEVESLEEIMELAQEVDRVEIKSTSWDQYEADITFICGNL